MKIVNKKISELIPYVNNTRTHSDEHVQQIASSIKEFGFTNPVLLDENNGVIAGHGRILGAKLLQLDEIPTITLKGLTEAQIKAYIIADNKLALNAGWDEELLNVEIEALKDMDFDIDLLGFNNDELDDLGINLDENDINLDESKADEVPEIEENPVIKRGDLIELGHNFQHRLLCGDSTSDDDVKLLMDGKNADFGFCDPPYNLGFKYNSYDDNKSDKEYREFSIKWFSCLKNVTDKQAVTLGTKNIPLMSILDEVTGVACWVKKNWITSCKIAKLQQWEPIFFYGDYTHHKRNSDLYEVNRKIQKDVCDSHTCPKQIELILDIFENYCENSVVDLFCGSGTSLIASENLNKICYGMELDEKYAQVIIQRYVDYTSNPMIKIKGKEVDWNEYKDSMAR